MLHEAGPEAVLRKPEVRAQIARDFSEVFHKDTEPLVREFLSSREGTEEEKSQSMQALLDDIDELLGPLSNAQRQLIGKKFDEGSSRDLPHYVKLDELKRYLEKEPFSDITYALAEGITPYIEGVDATLDFMKPD